LVSHYGCTCVAPCLPSQHSRVPAALTRTCDPPEPVDTVVLDVRGMKCGGCSAAVRRILVADPAVEAAAVNLLTESAVVRMRRPPHADPHAELGQAAAEMLTARVRPTAACRSLLSHRVAHFNY